MLKEFASKGVNGNDFHKLEELVTLHVPSLQPLLMHLKTLLNHSLPLLKCPTEWSPLLAALSSPSAVCALLHPNEQLFHILRRIPNEDITRDVASMSTIQKEVPIMFDLLRSVSHLPSQSLVPLIDDMIKKSMAPFDMTDIEIQQTGAREGSSEGSELELAYFPCLQKVRSRDCYQLDKQHKPAGCTKQSSGHPTLLPGIFTMYCPHGKCVSHYTAVKE